MENQENTRVVTLQAGETVILKAEDGTTISEVKKPKRNTAKERAWEKEKYYRFTFLVDKPQAEQFIELLSGKRPLDWFREEIASYIENTLNETSDTLNDNKNAFNVKCVRCGTLNDGYVNGYFRCSDCDFVNYEPTEDEDDNTLNETLENTFNVEFSPDEKPKRTRKPSPNADERSQWETEYNNGLSAKRIAEMFERDTRAVKKHLEQVGLLP